MMGASITTRTTRNGDRRYVVRYRMGGRAFPVQHAGSFHTLRDARDRRDLVAGEIAKGRDPAILLRGLRSRPAARTFEQWAEAYRESRVDLAEETRQNLKSHVAAMLPVLGDYEPASLTTSEVQDWIAGLGLKPGSVKRYLATLRALLDYAGVDPNPARDRRVRLPREQRAVVEPPSAADVEAIILHGGRWRLLLTTLAETGMRVGEACELEWRDVDEAGTRFRIRHGKTAAARRWVAVPDDLMAEITRSAPPDDRGPATRVFPGATVGAVGSAVDRACKNAKIAHYHPHDLRHRWASLQVARGVPITMISAQLGHSSKALTLDTYSHVLLDE
jgi:integrase